jgi:hypothetical protein
MHFRQASCVLGLFVIAIVGEGERRNGHLLYEDFDLRIALQRSRDLETSPLMSASHRAASVEERDLRIVPVVGDREMLSEAL